MSDWYGTHSTAEAANAGLDLEMPGPPQWFGPKLAQAVRDGEVDEKRLDDMVRRVLAILERAGALGRPRKCAPRSPIDDPGDRDVARRAASGSFVLLQNRGGALPLERIVRTLAVDRPERRHRARDGRRQRARADRIDLVSPLAGLRARFGDAVEIVHERGCTNSKITPPLDTRFLDGPLAIAYYAGRERDGRSGARRGRRSAPTSRGSGPVGARRARRLLGAHARHPGADRIRAVDDERRAGRPRARAARRRGRPRQLEPDRTRRRVLRHGQQGARRTRSISSPATGTTSSSRRSRPRPRSAVCRSGSSRRPATTCSSARSRPRERADAVVCVVGSDGQWETEGNDRESMTLPGAQDDLVRAVAAANPRTIVVVNAASPVAMPWADDVAAILQCWFAGEEWGNALADVLSGDVSPSGKLPTTFPVRIEDTPALHELSRRERQGALRRRHLRRLPLVRRAPIEPRFLLRSRTLVHDVRARRSDVDAEAEDGASRALEVPVTNTGRGAAPRSCSATSPTSTSSVATPPQELKAFAKVWLDPGETRDRDARARPTSLRVLGRSTGTTGSSSRATFELGIGTSSRDISLGSTTDRRSLTGARMTGAHAHRRPAQLRRRSFRAERVAPVRRSRARRRGRRRRPGRGRRPRRDGSAHRRVRVGHVPDAARGAVARTDDDARGDRGRDHDACGSRPASSSRRCGPRCCSRSRPRRSTCCRRAGSTSASAPAGSARSTTPKASTSTQRGQLLTDTHRRVQGAVARHAGRARHADALVPRHLLRAEAGAGRRRAAVDRRDAARAQPRAARALRRRVDPDHGRDPSTASRPAPSMRGTRGRPPAATRDRLQVQAPLRIARGDDGAPDIARSMESVPELVAAGATDVHVRFAAFCRDPDATRRRVLAEIAARDSGFRRARA